MNHGSNATTGTTACEMSMLWNWQTVDTCFLAESWHVTNQGMFAASCIGISLLATAFEALRRVCREYDHLVMRQLGEIGQSGQYGPADHESVGPWFVASYNHGPRRATPFQQLVRTLLHVAAVGVGYIIMLVLMSFNGYTFVSVLIGTGIGKFFCDWMTVEHDDGYEHCPDPHELSADRKNVFDGESPTVPVVTHEGCNH